MNSFIDKAAQEVLELHEHLAAWMRGESATQAVGLESLLSHFHPDFIMIAPMGRKQGRAGLAKLLQSAHGSRAELDITIVDLELVRATTDLAIFTYEEQRRCEHHFHRRISTAILTPGPDGQPLWLHLQETWIEDAT
jgi:hypothetical protein